tara:strand:- start:158 stop:1534 length:1377 start_codon:yes stop_codon:yes gene_type:complete
MPILLGLVPRALYVFCLIGISSSHIAVSFASQDEVNIPEGNFYMGENGVQDDESPMHLVWVSSFYIDRCEVTVGGWREIIKWAESNGYEFSLKQNYPQTGPSYFKESLPTEFPMNMINWYDAVKWCNARSEYHGRKPVYYTSSNKDEVYRSGELEISESFVDWFASGYRLPTEAEWEKAARGTIAGMQYPWGNSLDGSIANYKLSGDPFDDATTPVGYYNGKQQIQYRLNSLGGERQKAKDRANIYGLYDVVGNVSEWCWDWYDADWYHNSESTSENTHGPNLTYGSTSNSMKVHRGGGFKNGPSSSEGEPLRLAFRHVEYPDESKKSIGLRCVRSDLEDALWFDADSYHSYSPSVEQSSTGKWYQLNWFGFYFQPDHNSDWIFHAEFGWIFPSRTGGSYNNWIYFPKAGWLWTSKLAFPYFYHYDDKNWYKYLGITSHPKSFQRYSDKQRFNWNAAF